MFVHQIISHKHLRQSLISSSLFTPVTKLQLHHHSTTQIPAHVSKQFLQGVFWEQTNVGAISTNCIYQSPQCEH